MKPSASLISALLALAATAACSERRVATPRPESFPRISLYPAAYRSLPLPFGPDSLTVCADARADIADNGWINIAYPAYGVTVSATLTPTTPAGIDRILANRRQRIDRNLAGADARAARIGSGTIVVAPTALRTPVQILATDSASWVLSAVAVAEWPAETSPDSVAPIIDALARDMSIMLTNL